MHWIRSLAVSVAAMLFSGTALADGFSAVIFDEDTGLTGTNQDQSVGWEFNVTEAITVNGLQWYDDGGDGLTIFHEVGLWDPLGVLLAVAFIPAGVAAPLDDGMWRTIKVTPFLLSVGDGYIVGGFNGATAVDRLAFSVTEFVDPRITIVGGTFALIGTGFTRPTNPTGGSGGLYGPSFQIIPTPGAATLLLIGAVVGPKRRRRR